MQNLTLFDLEVEEKVAWNGYATTLEFDELRLLKSIMKLYTGGQPFDVDPTYSRGRLWRGLPQPRHKFDLEPQSPDVQQGDCRSLPFADGGLQSVFFDPPFLIKGGAESVIKKRFSDYPSIDALWEMYADALKEFSRVLAPKGICVFKCQDLINSGKQHWSHVEIYRMAIDAGFYGEDLLVLSNHNVMWSPNMKRQLHARKNHSFYWVFRKGAK